ncbi:hypothetical protein Tco_1330130 [Tanacetum coccineum]
MELITMDLICPSTYQLLRNSSGDSRPDLSFDKSASLERLFSLSCASLSETSKPVLSFGCSGGDYTSSCPPSLVLSLSASSYFPAMSKNDMKDRICTFFKNDLKDLVKAYRIPLDLHPCLLYPGFTMDHLPTDAIGIYSKFLWFSGVRVPFSTFLLSVLKYFKVHISQLVPLDDLPSDGYDRNDVQRLCARLICLREMREEVLVHSGLSSCVSSHTTTLTSEGAIILLPTPDEIAASLPDPRLAKKSKGPSQTSRPSKRRKMQKRASKVGTSVPELDEAEGTDEADLADLCDEIEDSLERDEGVSMRVVSASTPSLGKKLDAPPSVGVVSVSKLSHVGTSVPAYTSRRSISLGVVCGFLSVAASGHVGKSEAQMDEMPDDNFGIATRGEEIDLTLFPLALGPYHMPYPYEGDPDVYMKALDDTITPAELRRTESLLLLELSNRVNVLSALLVSHGYELNSRYTNLVSSKARLQEKFDNKKWDVKLLHSEVTSLEKELTQTDAKLSKQALTVKDLQNELVLEKSKSQEYKDVMGALKDQVTQFVGSIVESLVRKLLSSDEFHDALARVASLGVNYGIERGLRMGRTDVEFKAAGQKVSNFQVGDKADFDKALDDFPTTLFLFLAR